jgi:hypothetical protein
MVNQDSFTPQEYAKIVGMFPDPPSNPLPTGGYMDAGFDWVVHQAEARPINDDEDLLAVYDDAGEHKGFIEMEDDEEEEAVEIDISDEEMNEIAEIKLGAENFEKNRFTGLRLMQDIGGAQFFYYRYPDGTYDILLRDTNIKDERLKHMMAAKGWGDFYWHIGHIYGGSGGWTIQVPVFSNDKVTWHDTMIDGETRGPGGEIMLERRYRTLNDAINSILWWFHEEDGLDFYNWVKSSWEAETTMTVEHKDGHRYSETDPVHGERGEIIGHVSEITEEKDTPYQKIYDTDFVKPSRDWFSLALGTAAVVIGGSLFLQNRGVFKADGDEEPAPVGTGEPSLVAHPTTGDLLPADYEEMIVESTGYVVPVIPVSLDPSFMGSRFHALPTNRVVESNEPGIGAHTDVAINRDTNYREPEQSLVTEPPFAYRFNAEAACECSIFNKIKSFFTGKPCCVEQKEANSVTGQTPYFGVGFDGRNTQERVIKETNPISLDPSVSPYLPLNLSGYTGQAYAPPSIYSSMMAVGETGRNPAFITSSSSVGANRAGSRSVDSSTLQSVHGTLSANVNQSYTDGSRTMSLSQWSIEYDVSQISDTEAFAVSRASGERSMIRRV